MTEDDENANLVEEFPKPPSYYRYVTAFDDPPAIPVDNDPYEIIFGGSFITAKLKPKSEKSGAELAEEIKDALKAAIDKSLPLVSVGSTNYTEIGLTAAEVRASFASLYEVLREYRSYEALALLVEDRKQQLNRAKEIENRLITCLTQCKEALAKQGYT